MTVLRCPTCQRQFDSQRSDARPFCSDRCRLIDLGRWLGEEIGVPLEPEDRGPEPPPRVTPPRPDS
ncbi:MAG: DNA gyrase inhibitor YacG [Pirellulaceae bacterium]|nr:DNA gyrase inhibitor YacG [Pirellulaceae bacterium]